MQPTTYILTRSLGTGNICQQSVAQPTCKTQPHTNNMGHTLGQPPGLRNANAKFESTRGVSNQVCKLVKTQMCNNQVCKYVPSCPWHDVLAIPSIIINHKLTWWNKFLMCKSSEPLAFFAALLSPAARLPKFCAKKNCTAVRKRPTAQELPNLPGTCRSRPSR